MSENINTKLGKMSKFQFTCLAILCLSTLVLLLVWNSPIPLFFSVHVLIIGLFSGIGIWIINVLISRLLSRYTNWYRHFAKKMATNTQHRQSKASRIYNTFSLLTILILSLIIEELVFRGYLLSFTNNNLNVVISLLINMVLFSAIHMNYRFIQLSLMALVFSIITIYTDNILTSIIAHFINNMLARYFKFNSILKLKI